MANTWKKRGPKFKVKVGLFVIDIRFGVATRALGELITRL